MGKPRPVERAPHRKTAARAEAAAVVLLGAFAGSVCGMLAETPRAQAALRREGRWPGEGEELISLSSHGQPRRETIRLLAEKAGWSVVVDDPAAGTVDVDVTKQPAARVLELVLGPGDYLARRDGKLISIRPDDGGSAPAAAPPGESSAPGVDLGLRAPGGAGDTAREAAIRAATHVTKKNKAKGKGDEDRVVAGHDVVIKRDEAVGDLVVFGGSAQVFGRVRGDVSVFGGTVVIHEAGHVEGDVTTFGGSAVLEKGARVEGSLSALGGSVRRDPGAIVGDDDAEAQGDEPDGDDDTVATVGTSSPAGEAGGSSWRRVAAAIGGAVTRASLLFAFGAILWALLGRRMETLRGDVASRLARAFAVGVVGVIAGAAALAALCVTIVGIPIAFIVILAAIFATYAGVCAALTAAGASLLGRHTGNVYAHLAAGCAGYFLLSSIPIFGHVVTAAVLLIGFGTAIETHAAGLVPPLRRRPEVAPGALVGGGTAS